VDVIYILLGASLPIAIGFLIAFIRSARNGQFDDTGTPAIRMLMDDEINDQHHNDNQHLNHT
jgi:cbb3-type cytochrome oxidase maturation protein